MKLPQADWQRRDGMAELLRALDAERGATRYVGGCVRDTLLGLPVSDVDLATRLPPQEVMARLKRAKIKAVPTGLAHGTVTAVVSGAPVEVTTLRRDVATDGRRATIAYTDDWKEDAARRDFTINALSVDPSTLELHDYFDGEQDLAARRVRFIGDPLTRIAEDHLRILRFFRFHARFGRGEADAEGMEACAARANDLMALSRERIADELMKLLALPYPSPTVTVMVARGILKPVLPEIDESGAQRLVALTARERVAEANPEGVRRLGALLPRDPAVAASVGARLKLSNVLKLRLECIARPPADESEAAPEALAYRLGAPCAVDRLLLDERIEAADAAARVRRLSGWRRPKLPVTGGALIAKGLPAGPVVAATMRGIEEDWVEAGFPSGEAFARLVGQRLAQALRERQ